MWKNGVQLAEIKVSPRRFIIYGELCSVSNPNKTNFLVTGLRGNFLFIKAGCWGFLAVERNLLLVYGFDLAGKIEKPSVLLHPNSYF